MRVLLDTDVVLDVILAREPFAQEAANIFRLHERGQIDAYVAAITPVNVFYVTRKLKGSKEAQRAIELILSSLSVCPVNHVVLRQAYELPFGDYEDAVQHASALASRIDTIITRDIKDYKNATLPVLSPTDFLAKLESQVN